MLRLRITRPDTGAGRAMRVGVCLIGAAIWPLAGLAGGLPDAQPTLTTFAGDSITGEVIATGVLCPQFRIDGGEAISIEALPAGTQALQPGARLALTGTFLRVSRCMQGRAFRVSRLQEPEN